MIHTTRHIVAYAVIAAYGGISLLGHGLHWLTPDDSHHHGFEVVRCAVHGSADEQHHHHHAGEHHHEHHDNVAGEPCESQHGDELSFTAGGCVAHSHLCEICVFLAQARSEQPQLTAAIIRPLFSSVVAALEQPFYSPTLLRWHTPRGPPDIG